jgi:peptidyl-prolyl cis-trans isomerase C
MKKLPYALVLISLFAAPLAALATSPVLLTAPGGISVTADEVLADAAQRLPADIRAQALSQPKNVATLATDVAMRRALAAEAEQAQLDRDPMIALQIRLARERVLAEARLAQIDGQKPDRAALEKVALAEYRLEADKHVAPEQIRARHILIDARTCDAEKRIAQLLEQARAPGADFAALAREHSQDPGSARRGGDLGFFERGKMAPEFEKAAFALQNPGDVSEVVRSEFGLHIIRLEERRPAARLPFEKVRDAIVQDLVRREIRNRRTQATEAISRSLQLNTTAVEAFAQQPH